VIQGEEIRGHNPEASYADSLPWARTQSAHMPDDLHLNTKHHDNATAKKRINQYNMMDVCSKKQHPTLRS